MSLTQEQREAIVEEALPEVVKTAQQISSKWTDAELDECVGIGRLALWNASLRFDPTRAKSLWLFAAKRVRGEMIEYAVKRAYEVSRVACKLISAAEREEDDPDALLEDAMRATAGEAEDPETELRRFLQREAAGFLLAHHAGSARGGEDELIERGQQELAQREVRRLMQELPPRVAKVVHLFYEEELTLEQIGKQLGITKKTALRDHSEAKELLKKRLRQVEVGV